MSSDTMLATDEDVPKLEREDKAKPPHPAL